MHYEFHISVRTNNIPGFRSVCEKLGVKPIVLALQDTRGAEVMQDVMSSSRHQGDDKSAEPVVRDLVNRMRFNGFNPIRVKIETKTTHWSTRLVAPNGTFLEGRYMEAHIPVFVPPDSLSSAALGAIASARGVHRSQNAFKQAVDGTQVVMLTRRTRLAGSDVFRHHVHHDVLALANSGLRVVSEPEIEFVMWDSSPRHDFAWTDA